MNWFTEMFLDVSDRTKFFAILISAVVAVSVVMLNQYFNRASSRRTLDVDKIEELYENLLAFRRSSIQFLQRLYTKERGAEDVRKLLTESIEHIEAAEIITQLHFPSINIDSLFIHRHLTDKYNEVVVERHKGSDDWTERYESDCDKIHSIFNTISIACKKQMKLSRH